METPLAGRLLTPKLPIAAKCYWLGLVTCKHGWHMTYVIFHPWCKCQAFRGRSRPSVAVAIEAGHPLNPTDSEVPWNLEVLGAQFWWNFNATGFSDFYSFGITTLRVKIPEARYRRQNCQHHGDDRKASIVKTSIRLTFLNGGYFTLAIKNRHYQSCN